ncbi:MAG: AAA family ATPase [Armatimonadota bacterium]|nr:MAG: AAA family ATPase [Armatimonadota bacterium]
MSAHLKLSAEDLRHVCDMAFFDFETTEQVEPLEGTIGQERAVTAITFGFEIKARGYNIFASGSSGTGRNFAVQAYVGEYAEKEPVPPDWVYVHNCRVPGEPCAIELPAGKGRELARDMDDLIAACRREIPRAFDSDNYRRRRAEALEDTETRRKRLLSTLEQEAERRGLTVQVTPMGVAVVPLRDGEPMSRQDFQALSEDERRDIESKTDDMRERVNDAVTQMRQLEKEVRDRVEELDREVGLFAIGHLLAGLRQRYAEHDHVIAYLEEVQRDIIAHLDQFRQAETPDEPQPSAIAALQEQFSEDAFDRYRVNVFVDNSETQGAPVVVEWNPTYYNLFGRLEYRSRFGGMVTNFSLIKAGAIHRADGGYLILQAWDVLRNPLSWDHLKTVLRSGEVRIENIGEQYSPIPAAALRAQPIPVNVKVILVGPPLVYYLLYHLDEDFRKLFRVKADFDVMMKREPEHIREYVGFISARCREHGLRHLRRDAVCEVIEYGSRSCDHQGKLTTRFQDIADLLREADFWASKNGNDPIAAADVRRAIEERDYRSKLLEDRILDLVREGSLLVDVAGEAVGQANGLSVMALGDYTFGRPTRITARARLGKFEVVDIEREARLGGDLFHKAILIISGYLAGKYVPDYPLSLSASIAFEQSYEQVEGDSASVAEMCALLSSIADVPVRQQFAVTGSMNQNGEVQAVGGVTQKIEGFFTTCKVKGLSGDQGVIIPRANVQHLMLKPEVVDAVREGKFHVYAVSTIDEALELLTGMPAGERKPDGTYDPETINHRVEQKLRTFADRAAQFGRAAAKEDESSGSSIAGGEA